MYTPSADRRSALVFTLADRTYAFPTQCVAEIILMAEMSELPSAPAFISGFLNIGGKLTAVISLRELFGLPARERNRYSPLVILRTAPQEIAVEVDGNLHIAEYSSSAFVPLSETSSLNGCSAGIIRLEDKSGVLLSVEKLLFEQEQRAIADLAQLASQRLDHMEVTTA